MASRLDFSQIRSLYIGTSASQTVPTNNVIIDGNVLLGTTTDTGLKLDVNGSARLSGGLLYLGNYSANPEIILQATNNSWSKINFYDNNNTEGLYIRTDGASYGGTMQFGARWDDDEGKVFFKMFQSSAGAAYDVKIGLNTGSPESMFHMDKSSSSNDISGTPSIIISNKDSTSGTFVGGGIFNNPYRDVSTSSVTAGVWFENQNSPDAGAAAKSSDLVFGASSYSANWNLPTERMRITQGGNVGIGTNNPTAYYSSKLVVYAGAENGITIANSGTTGSQYLMFADGITGSERYQGFLEYAHTSNFMAFATSGTEKVRITSGGNVLINTTTDSGYKLDVSGTGRFTDVLVVKNTSSTPSIWSGSYGGAISILGDNATSNRYLDLSIVDSTGALAAQGLRIINSGNVLIGTTTDVGTKLNVNGVVNATDYYFNGTSSERVVKRYTAGITLSASGYTFIANVTGGSLASAVRMTMQGTSNGVVINVLADIQVNHYQDILVTTSSGFYTQVRIRIISNNNDVFSIEVEPVSAVNATSLYVEIYPLNDEVVSFSGSPQTSTTLTMTTRQGVYTVGNGGNNGTISAGGDLYVSDNVGIGTTGPSAKLDVVGVIRYGNNAGSIGALSYDTTGLISLEASSPNTSITILPSGTGNVAIGSLTPNSYLSGTKGLSIYANANPAVGFANTSSFWLWYMSGSTLRMWNSSATEVLIAHTSGNVTIGTTTTDAGYKLDVFGKTRIYTGAASGATTPDADTALLIDSPGNQYIELRTSSASSGLMQGILFTDNGQNAFIGYKEYTGQTAGTYGEAIHLVYKDFSSSDPNNGIYFGTSNTPSDGVSNVQMFIKGNGNVGIGTATPLAKLHVSNGVPTGLGTLPANTTLLVDNGASDNFITIRNTSDNGTYGGFIFQDNNVGGYIAFRNYTGSGPNDGSNGDAMYYGTYTDHIFQAGTQEPVGTKPEIMRIKYTGNVGIGTTTPLTKLEVAPSQTNSSIKTGGLEMQSYAVNNSWYAENVYFDGSNWRLRSAGYATQMYMQGGTIDFNRVATGSAGDAATLLTTMRLNNTGNVLIGTTTDASFKLDVAGNFRASTSGSVAQMQTSTNASEVLRLSNSGGDSGSVQGITHLGINFFSVGTNSPVRITAYQNGTSGYTGGMYFSTRGVNSDSAPTEAMRITHDQLIGLGPVSSFTSTHRVWIDKGSSTYAVYSQGSIQVNAGAIGVGVTPSATSGRIDAGNDIVAYSTSDQRLKENITPIANALDKVKSLTGVEFDWKEETKHVHGYEGHDVGVIAQEVQAVLPEAVRTNDSGYLSVRYEKMIALLVEANKELASRVEELEKKLK